MVAEPLVPTGSVVHRRDVDGERVGDGIEIDAAAGSPGIADTESEAVRGRAGVRRIDQDADRARRDLLVDDHRRAAAVKRSVGGQRGEDDPGETMRRRVVRIGKSEIGQGECARGFLERGDAAVGAEGRVADGRHIDGEGVRRLIGVDAAVGGAAIVFHLEGEGRIAGAVGVGRGREHETAEAAGRNFLTGGHGAARKGQRAGRRQRRDDDAVQRIGRRVIGIGEAEIGRREGVGCVLVDGGRAVGPGGGVVDGRHAERQRVGGLVGIFGRHRRAVVGHLRT